MIYGRWSDTGDGVSHGEMNKSWAGQGQDSRIIAARTC